MVDKTDASVMKKVRQILKENDEEIKRANEAFFHSKESIIDHIYVDLAAIKDTRMGLLLSLCKSPEEMAEDMKKVKEVRAQLKGFDQISHFTPAMYDYRNLLNFWILDNLDKRGMLKQNHKSKI